MYYVTNVIMINKLVTTNLPSGRWMNLPAAAESRYGACFIADANPAPLLHGHINGLHAFGLVAIDHSWQSGVEGVGAVSLTREADHRGNIYTRLWHSLQKMCQ